MHHLVDKTLRGPGIPEALPRGVVVSVNQVMNPLVGQGGQVGLTRPGAAQAADGVLDAAFLPGGVTVTEEGLDAAGMEVVMRGEFRAVVEGDSLAAVRGHGREAVGEGMGDGSGGFAGGRTARRRREVRSWRARQGRMEPCGMTAVVGVTYDILITQTA